MPERYYPLDLVVPAGTTEAAPLTVDVPLEDALLVDIEIIVPGGHKGFTGIKIRQSSQQVLPWGNNNWIIADSWSRVFDMDTEIGSQSISVQAFNTDFYDHTFYLRFHIRELDESRLPAVPFTPVLTSPLSSLSPLSSSGTEGVPPQGYIR